MPSPTPELPPFSAPYAPDDSVLARTLLDGARLPREREARIDRTARRLIDAIRTDHGGVGGVEEMLREFALSTKEGLALMVLAEALLRVPDAATADRFIEDKLEQGDFAHHQTKSSALVVNASAWALGLSASVIQPGETPQGTIGRLVKRIGLPAVRIATRQAMRLMGNHFVLGETIDAALRTRSIRRGSRRAVFVRHAGRRRTHCCRRAALFESYTHGITAIGRAAGNHPLPDRPGISVKLSALHPRYEATSRSAC